MRLSKKVALITGGASGLGTHIAQSFLAEGAQVFIADIDEEAGLATCGQLGVGAEFVPLDVASDSSWRACLDTVVSKATAVDILVNNAGILIFDDIESATLENWEKVQGINGTGVFLGCKFGVEVMRRRSKSGVIINVASAGSFRPSPENLSYCASKALVANLTRTVALHCANKGYGIRCNSLHPGVINTPMISGDLDGEEADAVLEEFAAIHPLGRVATAGEIARAAVFLASDDSAYMTGSPLIVDGGYTIA